MSVADSLSYMQANASSVDTHGGAAFAEVEILKQLADGTASGLAGIMGDIHLKKLQRRVPAIENRGQAYEFTHDVFFASDFGRISVTDIDKEAYSKLIESSVTTYIDDTDVLGELLIVAKCLDYWSPKLESALATFRTAWKAISRDPKDFDESYHVLLIGGILYTMLE